MYANGQGVQQDFAEAAKWYRKAADQGYANAQTALNELEKRNPDVNTEKPAAAGWLDKWLPGPAQPQQWWFYGRYSRTCESRS